MVEHVVKRGLDIPIKGRATGAPVDLPDPATVAYSPTEFRGITPRMAVREGDAVNAGQVLFFHKSNPDLVFRSPVAGRLVEVRRGARRVITDVVVEIDGDAAESFPTRSPSEVASIGREDAVAALLASGMWGALRTRPLDKVPDPAVTPQAIVVCASDSGPLMPSAAELLDDGDQEALQAAVHALRALTDGKVYLTQHGAGGHPVVSAIEGVEHHLFRGPHPAGDAAVHVNLLEPPAANREVWTVRAWDAVCMGRFLLEGRFEARRVYAAVGAGVRAPRFVRTLLGAPLRHVVGEVADGPLRWIRGSVLTGEAVDADRWAAFGARAVHVLPEEVPRYLFGWALPALGRWSFHKAFLSGYTHPTTEQDLRPGLYGGHRAIVPVGYYSKVVVTPDLLPDFLVKSIVAGDLLESLRLGLLDMTDEEAALCTYICPSKTEFRTWLRKGLDQYEAEV